MQVPVIETKRLKLRAHRLEDFQSLSSIWSDEEVVKHISGIPSTEQQSWMRLMNYLGHWNLMGFGYWAVELKETHEYIGDIGFADFKRDITPSISGIPEAGWVLSSKHHGKGYATEAVKAILEWGDKNLSMDKTVCLISPENIHSIKLATNCGYKETARTVYNSNPTILFTRNLH